MTASETDRKSTENQRKNNNQPEGSPADGGPFRIQNDIYFSVNALFYPLTEKYTLELFKTVSRDHWHK